MSLDITLLIGTCDKYHMLWKYFIILADRYFEPECRRLFVSEDVEVAEKYKSYAKDNYETHLPGKLSWSDRMISALDDIDTEYIFLLLDDYLLREKVTIEQVSRYIEFLEKVDGNKMMIAPYENKRAYQVEFRLHEDRYHKLLPSSPYQTAIMPSVVRTEWFKEILYPGQDIHEVEIEGTNAIKGKDNKIYLEEKEFPGIAPGIVRKGGQLIRNWKDVFKIENLVGEFPVKDQVIIKRHSIEHIEVFDLDEDNS